MNKVFWRMMLVIFAILFAVSFCAGAYALGSYEPVTVWLEVEGNGTYSLKPTDRLEPEIDIIISGKGSFELTYEEPGERTYLLYSKNHEETQKWNVIVTITADEEDRLSVAITCINPDDGTKPIKISYLQPEPEPTPTPRPGSRPGVDNKTGDERSGSLAAYSIFFVSAMLLFVVLIIISRRQKKGAEQ